MSILGIVAEYNPFHNGHLHHLSSAVSALSPSAVLVALSGPFTQRGEPALLSPFARADCALSAGADAVFALPVLWTVRDAEHYAMGAVSLLSSLGATHLAFGAETADLSLLQQTADLLENPPLSMKKALHDSLSEGKGYPAALAEAAGDCLPQSGALLRHPNNILAVCYLRAIRRLGLCLRPFVVSRKGSYHSGTVEAGFPSASALRDSLRRGAWQSVLPALPHASSAAVRSAFLSMEKPDPRKLDALLISRLRSMTAEDAARLPDCSEGLEFALLKAASHANSREELISALSSRRYPEARISRICAYALLNTTRDQLSSLSMPDSVLLLGLKKNPSLTGSWKNHSVKILDAAKWQHRAHPADLEAWRLWSLSCGLPASALFSRRLPTGE